MAHVEKKKIFSDSFFHVFKAAEYFLQGAFENVGGDKLRAILDPATCHSRPVFTLGCSCGLLGGTFKVVIFSFTSLQPGLLLQIHEVVGASELCGLFFLFVFFTLSYLAVFPHRLDVLYDNYHPFLFALSTGGDRQHIWTLVTLAISINLGLN